MMTKMMGEKKNQNTTLAHQLAGNLGNKALLSFFQRKRKKILYLIQLRNFPSGTTRHFAVYGGDRAARCAKQRSERREENAEDRIASEARILDRGDLCASEAFKNKMNSKSKYVMYCGGIIQPRNPISQKKWT